MDFWSDIKAENKIVRRNALRNILASVEKASPLNDLSPTLFYSQLLFEDEYDASRELSYKIASTTFQYVKDGCEMDEVVTICFEKIRSNATNKGVQEVEAVRVSIARVLSIVLLRGSIHLLKQRIDDVISVLRVYLADLSPEVVLPLISEFPQFISHMIGDIHMVTEALVHLLVGLLNRRQRQIRLGAIVSIRMLIEMDGDRNGIIVEEVQDSLFRFLRDIDEQNRYEMICLLEHCLRNEMYKESRLAILETFAAIHDECDRNQSKINEILHSSIA